MNELRVTWARRGAQTDRGISRVVLHLLAEGRPVTAAALATHPGVGIVDLDHAREIARAYAEECCRP